MNHVYGKEVFMKKVIVCVMGVGLLVGICAAFFLGVSSAQVAKERAKINFVYLGPMTGSAAAYGEEQFAAIQLAVKDINAAGGIKAGDKVYDFQAYALDVEESPEKSVTKMNEAISLYHPLAFHVGHSMAAMPLKQFAKEKGFILLGVSEVPGFMEPRNPLCIRAWVKVADQGPMLDYMRRLGINKIGLLAHSGEVSVKWAQVCREMWEKREGTVVGEVTYPVESTDFTSPVTKLLSYNPEAIAAGGHPDVRAANILKIVRELGFKGRVFFGGSCRGPRMVNLIGKELAEGTILVGTAFEKGGPKIEAFKKRIASLYPGKPYSLVFAVAYEAPFLIKAGVEQGKTVTDLTKITEAMETAVGPNTSPTGLFTKVVNGEVEFNLYPVEIKNGQVVPVP
jgi:branched-chain amino acid transport system substrate-binding protein